ncbi:TraB/GumN family protein [Jiella sp. M17.18]|uniref:TraB/GumN family protein n=1 Tax=Jiella sp. M17.18 TaxID=3234247 RepID=UPI0034DE1166
MSDIFHRFGLDQLGKILFRLGLAVPGLILACLLVGLVAARAEDKPADATCHGKNLVDALRADGKLAGVEAKAKAVPNGAGKLFRIEKDGLPPSYIFGTMHLTDPRVLTLSGPAETAFDKAKTLVIETTDVLDQKKAMAALLLHPEILNLPDGKTLSDYLDAKEKAAVEAALKKRGIPFSTIQTLQPWFTSASFMLPACETERKQSGEPVLDVELAKRAKAAGKPVEGLETAEEQLSALAGIPLKTQADSLVATLQVENRMPDILETMISLYLKGDIAMIMPAIEAAVPNGGLIVGTTEGDAAFEERVVTDRNVRMAERLQPILSKGGAFVAVGALHLPGEKGVVALLRKDGWTVTRAD